MAVYLRYAANGSVRRLIEFLQSVGRSLLWGMIGGLGCLMQMGDLSIWVLRWANRDSPLRGWRSLLWGMIGGLGCLMQMGDLSIWVLRWANRDSPLRSA
ncbi:MAG: hypothetical protein ACFE0J_22385 [Elainellaceae cyanobacterium]